jgi:hypothetical protein
MLTRTVKFISSPLCGAGCHACLSAPVRQGFCPPTGICLRRAPFGRFVTTLLNFCSCTLDRFVITYNVIPPSLRYGGQSAPVPFLSFIYRDYFPAVYQTCTAIAPAYNKSCTMPPSLTPPSRVLGTTQARESFGGQETAKLRSRSATLPGTLHTCPLLSIGNSPHLASTWGQMCK